MINIPTADEARARTKLADEKEALRAKRMCDEVYSHILEYVSTRFCEIRPQQTHINVPEYNDEFKGWERVGKEDYAGCPIPSMESAWEKAAEKIRGFGYDVKVRKNYDGYTTKMSLYITWKEK